MIKQHVFETAGLGSAPFRVVGHYVSKFQACPGAPVQPGTCCDFCGTGIMSVYRIRSADGREFKVGCDCVLKTGDAGLRRQVAAFETEAKNARADERIAAARESLPRVETILRQRPHKYADLADKGLTMYDWASRAIYGGHTGRAGKLAAARVIEEALRSAEAA